MMEVEPGNDNLPPGTDGSIQQPRRWIHISQVNCDQFAFGKSIDNTLHDIELHTVPQQYDDERYIRWDSLSAHKTAFVTAKIRDRVLTNNFCSVDRLTYQPTIAPIEYVFYELAAELSKRCLREWKMNNLRQNIYDVCSNIGNDGRLHSNFVHCGYNHNFIIHFSYYDISYNYA